MPLVRWHGHACFEVVDRVGRSIVFDPHDGRSLGLKRPQVKADAVLVSHRHFDHNAVEGVSKPTAKVLVEAQGKTSIDGIEVVGYLTYHDKSSGRQRGKNVVYKVVVDEVTFVHLGDLGHIPSDDVIAGIKEPDVLFVPVGGTFTIGPEEAAAVVEVLKPRLAVPMHYKLPGLSLPLSGVEEFLSLLKWPARKLPTNEYEVKREELPKETLVLVFAPP